jgi:hypothetical protein
MYKDKLQNCSCNQFHYIGTYKQVEKNSITKNRGGNDGSEKWIEKTLRQVSQYHSITVSHCPSGAEEATEEYTDFFVITINWYFCHEPGDSKFLPKASTFLLDTYQRQ